MKANTMQIQHSFTDRVSRVVTYQRVTLAMAFIAVAFWSFFAGGFFPSVFDDRLAGMQEVPIENIYVTNEGQLRGEFIMYSEDENVKIYRGEGALDD